MKATVQELIQATEGRLLQEGPFSIDGVSIDSRTFEVGNLFVAIQGKRYDGHQFIPEVIQKGAKAVLVERVPPNLPPSVTAIQVKETQRSLGDLARFHRNRFSTHLVAVTGSNGKTTTKELIAHLLSAQAQTLKNEGTQNNLIGVPLTLFRLTGAHTFCVVELGMNHRGEIGRLAEICRPTVGVLLNVTPAHLEFLGTLEAVFQSKMELVPFLPKGAPLILNASDRFLATVRPRHLSCIRFGAGGEFSADQVRLEKEGLRFRLNGKETVRISLFGLHYVENCLAAIATAVSLGMDLRQILPRLESFRPLPGRMEVRRRGGVTFIHDAYNANPVSVLRALQSFQTLPVEGRRIFVMGDMLELGEEAACYHEEVGEETVACGVDLLLTVGPLSIHTFSRAKNLGLHRASHFETHQELLAELKQVLQEGDWVLVKGSRGMRMERILEALEQDKAITKHQITITK